MYIKWNIFFFFLRWTNTKIPFQQMEWNLTYHYLSYDFYKNIYIFNSNYVYLFFYWPSYVIDIFSITYSNAHTNMYDKFIIFIGRGVRLGWYLYVSAKDLDLHPTWRLYLNLSPERYPHLNILLVKKN